MEWVERVKRDHALRVTKMVVGETCVMDDRDLSIYQEGN